MVSSQHTEPHRSIQGTSAQPTSPYSAQPTSPTNAVRWPGSLTECGSMGYPQAYAQPTSPAGYPNSSCTRRFTLV